MKRLIVPLLCMCASSTYADCDYANADQNFGYGWNGETGSSCPPINSTDACDYREADLNEGYGYNYSTGESCEPKNDASSGSEESLSPIYTIRTNTTVPLSQGGIGIFQVDAYCDSGDYATGGGCAFLPGQLSSNYVWTIAGSSAQENSTRWQCTFACVGFSNDETNDPGLCKEIRAAAHVQCLKAGALGK